MVITWPHVGTVFIRNSGTVLLFHGINRPFRGQKEVKITYISPTFSVFLPYNCRNTSKTPGNQLRCPPGPTDSPILSLKKINQKWTLLRTRSLVICSVCHKIRVSQSSWVCVYNITGWLKMSRTIIVRFVFFQELLPLG